MCDKGLYFEDIEVVETVTRRKLPVNEVMDILDRLPNVKYVTVPVEPRRAFNIETLAYPQYADDYKLTKEEWSNLQAYCREHLKEPIATDEVVAHWRSIANGTPPFGLKVQETK